MSHLRLQVAILGGYWDRAGNPMRTCLSARARETRRWGLAEDLGPEELRNMMVAVMMTKRDRANPGEISSRNP